MNDLRQQIETYREAVDGAVAKERDDALDAALGLLSVLAYYGDCAPSSEPDLVRAENEATALLRRHKRL